MTPYERLVVELTEASFSYQSIYRQGGTPYKLTAKEPLPYESQVEEFARLVEESDCILVGGASGLSAAGGGDFYYEDNESYRAHFGKFAERYGFKGAFEGSFYPWRTPEARWGYLAFLSVAHARGALGLSGHIPEYNVVCAIAPAVR